MKRRSFIEAYVSLGLILAAALMYVYPKPVHAASLGTLIQHRGCPAGGASAYSSAHCTMPNPTLAGNWLICFGQHGGNNALKGLAITDDKGDTFTIDSSGNASDGNQTVWAAHAAVTTGAKDVILSWTTASAFVQFWCGEAMNVTAVDVCSNNAWATTTSVTAGSITPTVANDLFIQMGEQDSTGAVTSWTTGSQANITWGLQQNDLGYGAAINEVVQSGVYSVTTALNPTLTVAPSSSGASIACSYKSGAAGTAAPAFYKTSMEHYNVASAASGFKIGAPLQGNLGYLGCINSVGDGDIASMSGSVSGSWTKIGEMLNVTGAGTLMVWYKPNATLALNDVLTITTQTPAGSNNSNFTSADCVLYGISGAATSPLDTSIATSSGFTCSSGICTNNGTQGSANTTLSVGAVTPANTNGSELLISQMGVNGAGAGGGDIRTTQGTFLSDIAYSPQENNINELDENNGKASVFVSSASAVTMTWTTAGNGTGVGAWADTIVGFNSAPSSGVCSFQLLGIGSC